MANDERLEIVTGRTADEFALLVNGYLEEGFWRVVQTEMSVTDAHYCAMLVKSNAERVKESE